MPAHRGSRANSLITQPYYNLKDIKEDLKNHCTSWHYRFPSERLWTYERLLVFFPCEDIKGKSIRNYLVKTSEDSGLNLMMCRSQTFDGAGNILGKTKRAVARFCLKTKSEKALYFHCASHELNLCLPKVPQVSNMLSFFFFFYIW